MPQSANGKVWEFQCSECGAPSSVNFEPRPGSRLLCRSCYAESRKQAPAAGHPGPDGRGERRSYPIVCSHCGEAGTAPFRPHEDGKVLCAKCMKNPNVERVGRRILHKILCGSCGQVDKVPFKPDPGSRVLCRNCHQEGRAAKLKAREQYHYGESEHDTKVRIDIRCDRCGKDDTLPFVPRTNGPILCQACAEESFGQRWLRQHRAQEEHRDYPFTCHRCSRTDFVPFRPNPDRELLCKRCLDDQELPREGGKSTDEKPGPYLFVRRKKP